MAFPLFIFLNALLLVRPEDLFPGISGLRLYLITITTCITLSLPQLQLTVMHPGFLRHRPIIVCVLGLFLGTAASFAFRGRIVEGFDFLGEFIKVILYFLLLTVTVTTPALLRNYLNWISVFVTFSVAISLLHTLDYITLPGLDPMYQHEYDPDTGELVSFERLISCGLFNDPNDFAVLIAFGMILNIGLALTNPSYFMRAIFLLPLLPSFYALVLTQSRGGLLALLAGVTATFFARFGWKKSIPLLALSFPAILFGAAGRQTGLGSGDTAHERLMMWAYGLSDLFRMPFHIFTGLCPGYYIEEQGLLAHNSYINAYVELGIIGGGFFTCAFILSVWFMHKIIKDPNSPSWAKSLGPFVFGAVVSYAVGCYSLSRNFHIPTYMVLGLGSVFTSINWPMLPERYAVTRSWFIRLGILSVLGLVFLKFSTQLLGKLGI